MAIDRGDRFIPSDPQGPTFIPSPTTSASGSSAASQDRWPKVGVQLDHHMLDPHAVIAAALTLIEKNIRKRLEDQIHMMAWEYTNQVRRFLGIDGPIDLPELSSHTNVSVLAHGAIEQVAEELGLTAGVLRGKRLVHQAALREVEQMITRIADDEVLKRHREPQRLAQKMIRNYLQTQEGRDSFARRRQASAGGDPTNPPAYRAPELPPAEGA